MPTIFSSLVDCEAVVDRAMKSIHGIDLKSHPNRLLVIISIIFLVFWVLSIPVKLGFVPLEFFNLGDTKLPTYQLIQFLIVFPIVLIITYFLFIRKELLSWKELGFNLGKKGLFNTVSYGVVGGLVQGTFIFYTTNHFLLKNQVALNLFEKCISAPIWEEFLYRVLLFTMIEMAMLLYIKRYERNSRCPKIVKLVWYFNIIVILSAVFSWVHGFFSPWIVTFAIIATLVYIKTRSIIAPSIAHSISNFVSGGFLYLILNSF